jgi:hypothetical protein
MRSKDAKCDKIKFFTKLLVVQGYIEKTPSNQNGFELYCFWAGGLIKRVGKRVFCINKALEVMPNVSRQ